MGNGGRAIRAHGAAHREADIELSGEAADLPPGELAAEGAVDDVVRRDEDAHVEDLCGWHQKREVS